MTVADPGVIVFPPQHSWIPNLEQLTDSARALLAIAGGVLDYYGRGDAYKRRQIQHGEQTQVLLNEHQILVTCLGMFPGKAGQELFQFADGAMGRLTQRFSRYAVEVWQPWPRPKGSMTAALPDPEDTDQAAQEVDTDGLLVAEAFRALSLGGVQAPVAPIAQDNVLVASCTPLGPTGGMAAWRIVVEIQL